MVLVVVVVLVLAVVVRALVAARPQNVGEHAEGRHERQIEEQLVPGRLVLLAVELFFVFIEVERYVPESCSFLKFLLEKLCSSQALILLVVLMVESSFNGFLLSAGHLLHLVFKDQRVI